MSKIGSYGAVVFETSDKKLLTMSNATRSVSATWAEHERIRKKPLKEFMHANPTTFSADIILAAGLGVKPRDMMIKLARYCQQGRTYPLVVGGRPVASHKMAITELSEAWDIIAAKGKIVQATVTVTFEEVL